MKQKQNAKQQQKPQKKKKKQKKQKNKQKKKKNAKHEDAFGFQGRDSPCKQKTTPTCEEET